MNRRCLAYCLLAVALWTAWGLVGKVCDAELGPLASAFVTPLGLVPIAALMFLMPGARDGKHHKGGILYAFIAGLCGAVGNLALLYAMNRGGKASVVYPLTGMYPLVTVLIAISLLHERLNGWQTLGILLAVVALVLFGLPGVEPEVNPSAAPSTASSSSAPAPNLQVATPDAKQGPSFMHWFVMCVAALVLFGLAGVFQKLASNHITPALATLWFALAFVPISGLLIPWISGSLDHTKTEWAWGIGWGALLGLGSLAQFAAYRHGPASLVTPIAALYPALVALLAIPLFKEKLSVALGAAIVLAVLASVALARENEPLPVPELVPPG